MSVPGKEVEQTESALADSTSSITAPGWARLKRVAPFKGRHSILRKQPHEPPRRQIRYQKPISGVPGIPGQRFRR
jgi:hypothetical protein